MGVKQTSDTIYLVLGEVFNLRGVTIEKYSLPGDSGRSARPVAFRIILTSA